MRILRHPANTTRAPNWCIFTTHIVPTTLSSSITGGTTYFVTKDVGSGIVVHSQHTSFQAAETEWISICNDVANNNHLGIGRPNVVSFNPMTKTINMSNIQDQVN